MLLLTLGACGGSGTAVDDAAEASLADSGADAESTDGGYDASDQYDSGYYTGESDGEEAAEEDGYAAGYEDAEDGEFRGYSYESDPNTDSSNYYPLEEDDDYLSGYDDGFTEGYEAAYEAAYDEGYDEALEYYRDPETENPYDEDCDHFAGSVIVDEDDPDNLDSDGDGIGCE